MSAFLSGFNSARALILIFLIGSCVFGYMAFEQHGKLGKLRGDLGLDSKSQLDPSLMIPGGTKARYQRSMENLVAAAKMHTNLSDEIDGDGVARESSPMVYIRKQKDLRKVALGRVDITPRTAQPVRGVTDSNYMIKPEDPKASFTRDQVSNFFFSLEDGSPRVRVTELEVKTANKVKDEELPPDAWTMTCTVTLRDKDKAN